jgi:hypothetical protein
VFFRKGVAQAAEIEEVRVFEDEIRRRGVFLTQRPRAPVLDPAHLGVEIALVRLLLVDERRFSFRVSEVNRI